MDVYCKEWRLGEHKFFPKVEVELRDDGKVVASSIVCWVNGNHPRHQEWIERILSRIVQTRFMEHADSLDEFIAHRWDESHDVQEPSTVDVDTGEM